MTKKFYQNTIFFLGLTVVVGLLQSWFFVQIGASLPTLPSFANFFLAANLISFLSTGFLLRYLYEQPYRVAFWTGIFAFSTALLRATLLYCTLVPLTRAFERYYLPVLFLDIGASLIYASSLVVSRTGRNSWLKGAGLVYFVLSGSTLALLIWSIQAHMGPGNPMLVSIQQWLSFAGTIPPLLLIGHFWQKQAQLHAPIPQSAIASWPDMLIDAARFLGVAALLFLGVPLFGEGIRARYPSKEALQLTQIFEARTFIDSRGDTLSYRLLKPAGYDFTRNYPLVISLHGGAGCGTDNIRQLANWEVQQLAEPASRKKYPAFVLVPQCPLGSSWGGLPNVVARDTVVFELMHALEYEFAIDTNRRYVAGGSLGGYGTWHFIGTHPGVFAAALPFCGGGNPAFANHMVDVAIWAFHGDNDKNVPVEGSRNVVKAIQKAGGHPRYTEFKGIGHDLRPGLATTPGIFDWLFAQKRKKSQ
ncbi:MULTISPECIES: peptidase [unclassified Spirosoma]|uniref:carboxylesterase family protein n=1 Tax=unclassified Spirosoma TaxID=2621999 RepID=UPI000AF9E41D|nr:MULTISPECIES: peptidase [unclassified Spirosoma]MBN8823527.1 peptidase [Spirosoma sp.]